MAARRGAFGASLQPFGGGTLNLDAAYEIGDLTPTPNAPTPGAPPPREYAGSGGSPWNQQLPIVGQTPVPNTEAGAPLPSWSPAPVTATTLGTLNRYITNLTGSGSDPSKLATYEDRREEYLLRGTPTGVDYSTEIASLDRYIANLTRSGTDPAKLADYTARRAEYAGR